MLPARVVMRELILGAFDCHIYFTGNVQRKEGAPFFQDYYTAFPVHAIIFFCFNISRKEAERKCKSPPLPGIKK